MIPPSIAELANKSMTTSPSNPTLGPPAALWEITSPSRRADPLQNRCGDADGAAVLVENEYGVLPKQDPVAVSHYGKVSPGQLRQCLAIACIRAMISSA